MVDVVRNIYILESTLNTDASIFYGLDVGIKREREREVSDDPKVFDPRETKMELS